MNLGGIAAGAKKIAGHGGELCTSGVKTMSLDELEKYAAKTGEILDKETSAASAKKIDGNIGKIVQSIKGGVDTLAKAPGEILKSRDTFVKGVADIKTQSMLGIGTLAEAVEKKNVGLIDNKFLNASNLIKRLKDTYSFIPSKFPSGEGFQLKKANMNEVIKNAKAGKDTTFEYTKNNGDIIKGFVSKKVQKMGEDCFVTQIQRTVKDGASEASSVYYFPKSGEIRTVSRQMDGQKVFSQMFANDNGGKVRTSC